MMNGEKVHDCAGLVDLINRIGFLPLLDSGIRGFSAEEMVDDDCRYVVLPDGGWDWPLWKWKGSVITEGRHVYGKFFAGKAGFISLDWWPDFCNYRRLIHRVPGTGSIEEAILQTLSEHGSMATRDLRNLCGFTGTKMRSRFDAYITRLQMGCRIVTEDFVYQRDRHNHEYGWGLSLLTTPERLYGPEACVCERKPLESFNRVCDHIRQLFPSASGRQIQRLAK